MGGTGADNIQYWISNFRWFIRRHGDEYTQIVKNFRPAFVDEDSKAQWHTGMGISGPRLEFRHRRLPGWWFGAVVRLFVEARSECPAGAQGLCL